MKNKSLECSGIFKVPAAHICFIQIHVLFEKKGVRHVFQEKNYFIFRREFTALSLFRFFFFWFFFVLCVNRTWVVDAASHFSLCASFYF